MTDVTTEETSEILKCCDGCTCERPHRSKPIEID